MPFSPRNPTAASTILSDAQAVDTYLSSTLPGELAGKAAATHQHSGTDIASGTIPVVRIGTGTKDATTYYRGDGTFAVPPGTGGSGGGAGVTYAMANDALAVRTLAGLKNFTDWLAAPAPSGKTEPKGGHIGEAGTRNDEAVASWNALAETWYAAADAANLDVSWWAAWPYGGYGLAVLDNASGPNGINEERPNLPPVTHHPETTQYRRGVDIAGPEFGSPTAAAPGIPGTASVGGDYVWPRLDALQYVAARGIKTVRVPFAWERIQPTLSAALNAGELGRMQQFVADAGTAGMRVILDCHNYCRYTPVAGTTYVMQRTGGSLNAAHLTDLWTRLDAVFGGNAIVVGYDIQNEPNNIAAETGTFAPTVRYDFEDGTLQGASQSADWVRSNDATRAHGGTKSLKTERQVNPLNGGFDFFEIEFTARGSASGDTLNAFLYMETAIPGTWQAQLAYNAGAGWVVSSGFDTIQKGLWYETRQQFGAPLPASGITLFRIRVQANDIAAGQAFRLWIDDLGQGNTAGGLNGNQVWESLSQSVVTGLRGAGSTKDLYIEGNAYAGAARWTTQHPAKWIADPLGPGHFYYSAHHYFDPDNSGIYGTSGTYALSLTAAQNAGYAANPALPTSGSTGGTGGTGVATGTALPVATKTSAYTLVAADRAILADTTSGAFTLTLPVPSGATGIPFQVKQKAGSSALTVATASGTIDGVGTFVFPGVNSAYTFISDGTNYFIF